MLSFLKLSIAALHFPRNSTGAGGGVVCDATLVLGGSSPVVNDNDNSLGTLLPGLMMR